LAQIEAFCGSIHSKRVRYADNWNGGFSLYDIARRLGWDQTPLEEDPVVEPHRAQRSQTIPQGAEFLLNPPERFEYPSWGIEYRLLQNTNDFISYVCTINENSQVDLVIFLKNRYPSTITTLKGLLKGSYKMHYFEDFNYPIASLIQEHSHKNNQAYAPISQWSICNLLEITGIDPGGR
jgi:hypothetical protein